MSYHIPVPDHLSAHEAEIHYTAQVALEMSTALVGSTNDTASPYTPTPLLFHVPQSLPDVDIRHASALGIAMAMTYYTGQDHVITLDVETYLREDGAVEFEYDIDDYTAHWGSEVCTAPDQRNIVPATPMTLIVHLRPESTEHHNQRTRQQAFFDPHQLHLPDALSYIQYHAPKILKDSHNIDWRLQHTVVFNHCDVTATPSLLHC